MLDAPHDGGGGGGAFGRHVAMWLFHIFIDVDFNQFLQCTAQARNQLLLKLAVPTPNFRYMVYC